MADFLPRKENALLQWSQRFSGQIAAAPVSYGLTAGQAAAYAALDDAFAAALAKTSVRQIRSMVTVVEKNAAKALLVTMARQLSMIVKGTAGVTATQRIDLGINPGTAARSATQRPESAPSVQVNDVTGTTAGIILGNAESPRLGKPDGVRGAMIHTFIGDEPPSELGEWVCYGTTTRRRITIRFASDLAPGTQVWFCARWLNSRLQAGPISPPRSTRLPGGGVGMTQSIDYARAA